MITEGRTLQGDLKLECDVVVVGSGAGGAVVAKELSESGLDVIVLEEGGHTPIERYGKFRPTETLRTLARDAGTTAAFGIGDTPLISLILGRTVGGSSTMTGGVCFRIPTMITERWVKELGLKDYSDQALEDAYRSVEREVNVTEVPVDMRSQSTNLFVKGAEKKGIRIQSLRRNTRGCVGMGRCNFGCPKHAKLSVDLTYLKKAFAKGTRLFSDCLVERVLIQEDRAVGVEGRILGADAKPRGRLTVRAKRVVVSAGTVHTPKILSASGVARASGQLGRHITLHPAFRVAAHFDQDVSGWKGAEQSVFSSDFEHEGITLVGIWAPVNILAAAMPGVGREHGAHMGQMKNLAIFGAMVHDDGGGRLWNVPGREPVLTYKMHPRDKARMLRGMRLLAESFFEAGARDVMLPMYGMKPLTNGDGLKVLDQNLPARVMECAAFHPLGSARIGVRPEMSCVKPTGETWDVRGLYVADGSLFPTSIGVNSQLPIMTVATRVAWNLRDAWHAGELAA